MADEQKNIKYAKQLADSQKDSLRIQKEYNEALRMSASINKDILSDIDSQVDRRTKLGKKAKEYLDGLKTEISSLQSSEDISNKLVSIEEEKVRISKSYVGSNKELGQVYINALNVAQKSLNIEQQRVLATERVSEAADKLAETLGGAFDGLNDSVKEIPVIGKLLGGIGDVGTKMLKDGLGNAAKSFTTKFSKGLREGKSLTESLSGATAGLGESIALLANPYVLAIGAVVAVAAAGIVGYYKLASAAKAFREETGLLNSQTIGLDKQMASVLGKTSILGASLDDIAKGASAFTQEFSGIEMASEEVLTSMMTLNKNFGVGVEEGAKLNKIFQNIGGLSAEQSQYLIGQTVSMARLAKVAPSQVIKDMAESSEYAYRYFNGSPEALAKSAVQAAKLGTSIAQAGHVADNLLDFQNSITSELEASALLGTTINLGQARYLAANGKILEAQQAVVDQVATLGDLTKLNTYEQEALTKATGMPMADLINQQRIRERFGKLGEEELATAMQVLKTGGDISKMNRADLAVQSEKLSKQKEMQSEFDNTGNQLAAIGNDILMAFMPIGTTIMKALGPIMEIVGGLIVGFLKPFMAIINNIFDHISKAFAPISKLMGPSTGLFKIFEKVGEVIGFIVSLVQGPVVWAIETVITAFSGVFDIVGGIIKLFTGDFMGGLAEIGDGLVSLFFSPFISGFNVVMDYLEGFFTIFESLGQWMHKNLIDPINNFIGGIGNVVQSVASFFGGGAQETASQTTTPAINDGVVQGGKVVSTNPADTIIATKNPQGLGNQVGGGIDISALVNKMDEMIAAVSANRDVYMDREKVSSAVVTTSEKSSQNRFGLIGA